VHTRACIALALSRVAFDVYFRTRQAQPGRECGRLQGSGISADGGNATTLEMRLRRKEIGMKKCGKARQQWRYGRGKSMIQRGVWRSRDAEDSTFQPAIESLAPTNGSLEDVTVVAVLVRANVRD